jgi:hypothetical protein
MNLSDSGYSKFRATSSNPTLLPSELRFRSSGGLFHRYALHPVPAMLGENTRSLWCIVDGDPNPFEIVVTPSHKTNQLQEEVKLRKVLHNIDASSLKIWKVRTVNRLSAHTLTHYRLQVGLDLKRLCNIADWISLAQRSGTCAARRYSSASYHFER